MTWKKLTKHNHNKRHKDNSRIKPFANKTDASSVGYEL